MVWKNLDCFLQLLGRILTEWVGHALEDKEGTNLPKIFFC